MRTAEKALLEKVLNDLLNEVDEASERPADTFLRILCRYGLQLAPPPPPPPSTDVRTSVLEALRSAKSGIHGLEIENAVIRFAPFESIDDAISRDDALGVVQIEINQWKSLDDD